MTTNRLELIQMIGALEAFVAEARASLKRDAEAEFISSGGMIPSWKAPDGSKAEGSMTRDRCEVEDQDAFMAWLVEHKPQLVHTVVVPRDPKVVAAFLAEVAECGPRPDPATGERPKLEPGKTADNAADIPGVVFVQGGAFNTLSLTIDSSVKRRLKAAAANYLAGAGDGAVFELEELFRRRYDGE